MVVSYGRWKVMFFKTFVVKYMSKNTLIMLYKTLGTWNPQIVYGAS